MEDFKETYRLEWEVLEKEEKALEVEKKKLSEEWILIEKYQQCYEMDRATFEGMVDSKFNFLPDDEVVQFNIGGKLFKSTIKVWTRDRFSILAQLCTKHPRLAPDARGHFYFDRDWWIFKYIYAFLRDKTLPDSLDILRDLYYEASYYRITLLRHAIEAFIKNQSATDTSRAHNGHIASEETHRQKESAKAQAVAEREWASKQQTQAARSTRLQSKRGHVIQTAPQVHPIRHGETVSPLNMHTKPSDQHIYRHNPPTDYIDRRPQQRHYEDNEEVNYRHGGRYQEDHGYPPRRHYGYVDPHTTHIPHSHINDYQDPYEYDRYHRGYGNGRGRHQDYHYHPEHHHNEFHSRTRMYETPMSPPLPDPHGFLSRNKMPRM